MSLTGGSKFILTGGATNYQIARSLRFRSGNANWLSRTFGTPTNQNIWTYSTWIKRGLIGGSPLGIQLFSSAHGWLTFGGSNMAGTVDVLKLANDSGPTTSLDTVALWRDPSAWNNIVVKVDTTQATPANRMRMYKDGVEMVYAASPIYPAQNTSCAGFNVASSLHYIARYPDGSNYYFDGLMAETIFIDGQALAPSSFGQIDLVTGVWVPIAYTGTYGSNGFRLDMYGDGTLSATTGIGHDASGTGNNWANSGFSVTAGVTNDSLVDTPTNYGIDTGAGGEVRGNYCTLNPLWKGANQTLSNGNLTSVKASGTTISDVWGTFPLTVGKWYFECTVTALATTAYIGVGQGGGIGEALDDLALSATSYFYASVDGSKKYGNSSDAYGSTFTAGDVIGCAVDMDNGKIWWRKNGTWQASGDPAAGTNAAYTDLLTRGSNAFLPFSSTNGASNSNTLDWNFGQRPYAATAPSGFKALCTQNLPNPAIAKPSLYMDVNTRAGTGAAFSVTGKGFQPDLVWSKGRSGATDHAIYDSVRGVQKDIGSNLSTAETTETQGITAFNSDGFSGGTLAKLNTSAATYVDWLFKKGATPGIDIVSYTGNGANRTIAHALGVAPKMMLIKDRSGTNSWRVYHASLPTSATNGLLLNGTNAAIGPDATLWNSADPTSSVFSLGSAANVNTNLDTYIAYLFAEVAGFSKFGSYTGNGSADGPFVWCGFRPRWILIKSAVAAVGWVMFDTARDSYNVSVNSLVPSATSAESSANSTFDFLSNGFKLRNIDSTGNGSGTYIFAAFAESPFKTARAR